MAQSGGTLAHRWFEEVWNQKRESAIDEFLADGVIVHGMVDPDGKPIRGAAEFKALFRKYCTAFPDIRITVEDALVDGNKIAVRCVATGTHTGPGMPVPPTNKPISFTGMCIMHIKDGKIAEGWNDFDFLSMHQQLGMQLS